MANEKKMTHSTAFSPGAEASKAQIYSTTRNQVLDQVTDKAQKKEVPKRMEGKVGIITGAGPPTGIGVSHLTVRLVMSTLMGSQMLLN